MFNFGFGTHADARAVSEALGRSLGIIEFDPSGKILTANENFCNALGYELAEIKGQHHNMFMEPNYARSAEYRAFWAKLGRGDFDAGEYKRFGKGGREVWIQASYNPVRTRRGKVVSVVKQATDITAEKLRNAEADGKLKAISRAQAVIEFTPSGEILVANENFLTAFGYRLEEIKGQHHRIFVEPGYAHSAEYAEFWRKLNAGEYIAAEFKRFGKSGTQIWIQASYNPVYDMNGKVTKIVKFATDITERVRAVTEIAEGLTELSRNNLAFRLDRKFIPAFEKLRNDFNNSLTEIASVMTHISESSTAIQTGTQEISVASNDLSRRTETQAASLEETAAALDEITTTVKKTAEGAKNARTVVANAKADAEHSGEIVRKAVTAMNAIETSSRQIAQIIGVIDEIAFQTNLLALNAGVEAARAGDAGKGFAVVASEVRGLAQRSAEAAKEIKALILASSQQVGEGVELVDDTGKALGRIVHHVNEINGIVSSMATSAQEQATALAEVNLAVNQMDQVTQQNAAMVEQTAAASGNLAQETKNLNEMVGRFRIGNEDGMAHNPPQARKPQHSAPTKVVAMKATGRGGAARRPGPQEEAGGWEEF